MSIGKMVKHVEMLQHPVLRRYLPETYWFTSEWTIQMLMRYPTIFIKPNYGSGGSGIIRVTKMRNSTEVRCGQKRKFMRSGSLNKAIRSYMKPSQRYLVQRGLRLAKYNGTIFDARIYMQKPKSEWIISGMSARVAAPKQYVTNHHKGGYGKPLGEVLAILFKNNDRKVSKCMKEIKNVSLLIAQKINKRHPIRELGIDLGIEEDGRIWIIEANSHPGHMLFTQLHDKTMLRRIMRNKRLIRKRIV